MYQARLETMPREELEKLQLKRLRTTLEHIRNHNPRYAQRFGDLRPEDLTDLSQIRELPFITKDELRRAYPLGLACAPKEALVRFHMSSGTTGTPVINPFTRADVEQWAEIMARCLTAAGLTPADVLQITPGFGLFNGGFGFHYGAERIGCFVVPIGPGRTLMQLKFMRDFGTTALAAISSYPLRLIEVARKEGFDFRETRLRVGIFGAEVWSDETRKYIEESMGIETFDIIGMTETGGVGLGIDCRAHEGIHIWEDHYLVEIVDPETGEVLPDGREGEMVVTTLTREGLPLIRYRTRDITRIISRERCSCGRTMLRVDRIRGRTDDMLKAKGVNFYPRQIEEILMRHPETTPEYLIRIGKKAGKDFVEILVECRQLEEGLSRRLEEEIYNFLGFHARVKLLREGDLPRSEGKARRVERVEET